VDHESPPPLPWWARGRFRLALLGVALASVVALGAGQLTGGARGGSGCWIGEGPPAAQLRAGAVAAAVPRLGLRAPVPRHAARTEGLTTPNAAFTDDPPTRADLARDPQRPVTAGYAVRWSTPAGQAGGTAAFRFIDPDAAQQFLDAAVTPGCRPTIRSGTPVPAPRGAHALLREASAGRLQTDVFFVRGSTAYWVFEASRAEPHLSSVAALACRLPAAGCG
jgi:hypothetical protein